MKSNTPKMNGEVPKYDNVPKPPDSPEKPPEYVGNVEHPDSRTSGPRSSKL